MTGSSRPFARVFARLLRLFPRDFREQFGEEMLLDFREREAEARSSGAPALLAFVLAEARDLPINLVRAHLEEDMGSTVPNLARGALRGAAATGLAFVAMMLVYNLFITLMTGRGWLFILRIANARGWHMDYNAAVSTALQLTGLLLGAPLAALVLAAFFGRTGSIRAYVLPVIVGWIVPLAVSWLQALIWVRYHLPGGPLYGPLVTLGSRLVIGLGFGLMFAWIVRRRAVWLLLTGALTYYAASSLGMLFWNSFGKTIMDPSDWRSLVYGLLVLGVEGALVGAALGAVAGGRITAENTETTEILGG